MTSAQLIQQLQNGALDARLCALYGADALPVQRERYRKALQAFSALYGAEREVSLFSVPGRTELSGNHTDHNGGRIIAAAVDLDIIAVAARSADHAICVQSEGFAEARVENVTNCRPNTSRHASSDALIAGVCAGFQKSGHTVGGFCAYTTSNVPKGSGLSSSAAFENMIGNILNHFYNEARLDGVEIAKISQYAENEFFGKPCGLMDQLACAVGGIITVDFAQKEAPVLEKIHCDLCAVGYQLCIVNTGGNHADLTPDYAAIPHEMHTVAAYFGKQVLREVDETAVLAALPALREQLGDRAVLRALHFFAENRRVQQQAAALRKGNVQAFLAGVQESGRSSFQYLQNLYPPHHPQEQGLSLALCLADRLLEKQNGAFRVHGGGFAGTVQAFVPVQALACFCNCMNAVFGENACTPLRIRAEGAIQVI